MNYSTHLKKIFSECLRAEQDDVLIVGDTGLENRRLAPIYAGACFLSARGQR